jgi:aminoglycoside phosphotransferase (APT) family kinase protein
MTQDWIDRPQNIRPGEELDILRLEEYLRTHLPEFTGDIVVRQFPGGHSNLTYLLRVGDREVVLRRPPFGKEIKSAHDMGREYHILSHLAPVYSRVPKPLLYCEDKGVLGAPFYIMERVTGVILRAVPPKGMDLSPEIMAGLSNAFIENMVVIHQVDLDAAGLSDFGHPEGYVKRQIHGWTERYYNAQTDDIQQIDEVVDWLGKNLPVESGIALIHNDYKYDNLVLDPMNISNIIGVLDWEMATVGDPLMDLGTTLGYWIDPDDPPEVKALAFNLTTLPGNLNRIQLAEKYGDLCGCELAHLLFYYVYALFKIAVIVQQIYARYKAGFSKDKRFEEMIQVVRVMGKIAASALELRRIDRLGR